VSDAAPGSPVDITANVRSVFKLFADKVSPVYADGPGIGTSQVVRTSVHEPWITVMVIDIPEELFPGMPLPAGPGHISITTAPSVTYPSISSHINDKTIAMEILPEILPQDGIASTFTYEFGTCCTAPGNLSQLEAQPHALVKSDLLEDLGGLTGYGAIEMKLDFTGVTSLPINESNLHVAADDMTAFTDSGRSIITGINNQMLTVIMISPKEKLKAYEMRFAAAPKAGNTFTGPLPTVDSVAFYNINGGTVTDTTNYTVELR
ncbi:MAG: hypothetical protein JRJ14_04910, partial [Deltaproteobacteria bacterium]|nr:hypothetical protein [Deltaproteobacteria bacterium]